MNGRTLVIVGLLILILATALLVSHEDLPVRPTATDWARVTPLPTDWVMCRDPRGHIPGRCPVDNPWAAWEATEDARYHELQTEIPGVP